MGGNGRRVALAIALALLMVASGPLAAIGAPAGHDREGPRPITTPSSDEAQGMPSKKWTFIVFLFSDSSQHGGVLDSYYNMVENMETRDGFSDSNINVLVMQDRERWYAPDGDGNTYAYYVRSGKGASELINLGEIDPSWVNEVNMGSRRTLIAFGTYVIEHYPAQHYALLTRSAGWWPDNFGEDENDLGWFGGGFDNINVYEMRDVLCQLSRVAGKRIDVLNIGGCTSGLFEWAYDFYPFCDYFVGTETYSIGSYWRIYRWISALRADIARMTPEGFSKVIVNEYMNQNRTGWNPYYSNTASAINMSRLKATADAIDGMCQAMLSDMPKYIHDIWPARDRTVEIDNYLRVDAYEIAMQIRDRFPSGSLVNITAQRVMDTYQDMVILNGAHTGDWGINVSTSRGLSLYFVRDAQTHALNAVEGYRSSLHFSLENHWLAFLDEFFSYLHCGGQYVVGDLSFTVWAGSGDADGDGWSDDIVVSVVTADGQPLALAKIYLDGRFSGLTDTNGVLYLFSFLPGTYAVTAVYGELTASTTVYTDGYGPGLHLFIDLTTGDFDDEQYGDDVLMRVRDQDGNGIAWGAVYTDLGWVGYTDGNGYIYSYDYKKGYHYVYIQVWGYYWVYSGFYSVGGPSDDITADLRVIDYPNDGVLNDLDVYVRDRNGELVTGAVIYIDDRYQGETVDGRLLRQDSEDGVHRVDIYYKYGTKREAAFFKDVRVTLADLDGDGMEETASVKYDVGLSVPAMDVKVTVQVLSWSLLTIMKDYHDNFTVVRDRTPPRTIDHTAARTGMVNIIVTLTDANDFIKDRRSFTGLWLQTQSHGPPVASLFARPTTGYVGAVFTLNATNSYAVEGNLTGYLFDFGDGTNSSWTAGRVATHVYKAPGNYTVNLMVRDDLGGTDPRSNQITLWVKPAKVVLPGDIPPRARLFARPAYTYVWDTVGFNGTTSDDPDGTVVEFDYSFGDGTTTGWVADPTVMHVYNTPGNFSARLKVRDDAGGVSPWSGAVTLWVRERAPSPPHAYLTVDPAKARTNESVKFDATGSTDADGTIYRYLFDFGDGTEPVWTFEPVVAHIYTETGHFTAKVKVEDDLGSASGWSKSRSIDVVGNQAPTPYLFARPHTVLVGQAVGFNASASTDPDGQVAQYYLDFGDGTISGWTSQAVIDHAYIAPGNYTVFLLVRDDRGAISTFSSRTTVTVTENSPKVSLSSPAATMLVLALFVVLMVAGTLYEVRRSRLGGTGYGVGPPVEERDSLARAGAGGQGRTEGTAPSVVVAEVPAGPIAQGTGGGAPASEGALDYFEPVHDGRGSQPASGSPAQPEEVELVPVEEDRAARPGTAPPETMRVTCMGCGSILTLRDGPRPIRVTCGRCGKGGVIR
jgi:PKD repeat protein